MKRFSLLSATAMFVVLTFTAANAEEASTLFGTKWKLDAFFSAETNELKTPDNGGFADTSDQEDLFTLVFSRDSIVRYEGREYQTCKGRLAFSTFWGLYTADNINSTIGFEVLIRPSKIADPDDGERYDRALYLSRTFELKDTCLKIYYGDRSDYLLFKPWGWRQSGVPDVESSVSRVKPNTATTVAVPEIILSPTDLAAGPNPVPKSAGLVNFYRVGKQVKSSSLKVYDNAGKFIGKIAITDVKTGGGVQSQSKRQVGSWPLKDSKGRPVSEGAYLVKGTIKTVDGKSERVSLLISVSQNL
jgi:hypothetical protein